MAKWLKQPGEPVKLDEPIASLETDKVAIDVMAPVAGVMGQHIAKEGDTVSVGALIARIEAGNGGTAAPRPRRHPLPAAPHPRPAKAGAASAPAAARAADDATVTLSPSVRRLVLERGVDPSSIKGTGKDGRLTKEDCPCRRQGRKPAPATRGLAGRCAVGRCHRLPAAPRPSAASGTRSGCG